MCFYIFALYKCTFTYLLTYLYAQKRNVFSRDLKDPSESLSLTVFALFVSIAAGIVNSLQFVSITP